MDTSVRIDRDIRERILVIDDERRICESLSTLLAGAGYEVVTFQESELAAQEIRASHFDLILSDIKMPGLSGLDILRLARQVDPQALVVLMTGYGSLETAVDAINQGAYDYLLKPVEFPQLEIVVKRGLERRRLGRAKSYLLTELRQKNRELEDRLREINALYEAGKLIGSTIKLEKLLQMIIQLATEVLHAKIGSIMLLDDNREYLSIAAAIGLDEEIVRTTKLAIGASIAGFVAQTGQPLFIADVEKDPRFSRENRTERYGPSSLLSVPLKVTNRVIGVINIAHKTSEAEFGDFDLKLLTAFSSQAAVAIDNAATMYQLKRRVAELSTLQDITDAMSRAGTIEQLQEIIFWGLRTLMPVDISLWFRWMEKEKCLTFAGAAGNARVSLNLAIKAEPDDLATPEKARDLMLAHLPAPEECGVPRGSFAAFLIYGENGLTYVFCLAAGAVGCCNAEDLKIAGLIASQAASMYERERAILNATRILTMGNMISEISHDMRKPLTSIRGALQIMRSRWPEMAGESDLFRSAEEEMHHLNELVRELVDFSNPNKYQTERVEMTAIMDRASHLVRQDIERNNITIVKEIEDKLPEIFVNKNQIMEMLLNLIMNAIEAIGRDGRIILRAVRHDFDKRRMIRIDVVDDGPGIDPKDKASIFDRYFTTKENGTGLGLPVVERIVSAHGGRLEVQSEKGLGTTFSIYLPG